MVNGQEGQPAAITVRDIVVAVKENAVLLVNRLANPPYEKHDPNQHHNSAATFWDVRRSQSRMLLKRRLAVHFTYYRSQRVELRMFPFQKKISN